MDLNVQETCKVGQGANCCRYLVMAPTGFECAKLTDFKSILDERVKADKFVAKGDNCDGFDHVGRALADKYVSEHADPEVRRMYGHHFKSFMAGYNANKREVLSNESEQASMETNEHLEQ
jgi:hypothetical protein